MRIRDLASWAFASASVWAYQDTSPFFIFSTSELLLPSISIASSSSIDSLLSRELSKCSSKNYIIVSQPGVQKDDYRIRKSSPHLRAKVSGRDEKIRSASSVDDVRGKVQVEHLLDLLKKSCGAKHTHIDASLGSFVIPGDDKSKVITLEFPVLPTDTSRVAKLQQHDRFLRSVLDTIGSDSYTVAYTTSPGVALVVPVTAEPRQYEMDDSFEAPLHMELKRAFDINVRSNNTDITLPDGGLFERYQFFGSGIFMGLVVALILLSILYVAMSGVASLQVSYAAFDKEMGPAAQKKQQQ